MAENHILLVTFPALGHINPSLQFAERLAKHGLNITFLTGLLATSRMPQTPLHPRIDVVSFPTGFDGGFTTDQFPHFLQAVADHGTAAVEAAHAARPFTRVVYTLLVPWAGHVARRLGVPATLLWIQPAAVFGIYFQYYRKNFDSADEIVDLPGLPVLKRRDLPSFFQGGNPSVYDFGIPMFTENFQILDREDYPTVLINTFDVLEMEALRSLSKYKLLAIGPLIPSAFLDGDDPSDTSFVGDFVRKPEDYMQYLDSAEKESVVYIAFGSYSELSNAQTEAIAEGLIRTRRPFLWVIRGSNNGEKLDLRQSEVLKKQGKIMGWCNQVEVLSHPSVGCFVTHCGWNSTLEGLSAGVPLVMLPQWTDQATNAKLVHDLWGCGVRAERVEDGEIVGAREIERCLEIVMDGGDVGREMRVQGKKWRGLAKEAIKEGGPSDVNLKIFVDEIVGRHG